jgi:hypothetical protein
MRAEESGGSECRPVMGRIGVEEWSADIIPRESGQTSAWSFITRIAAIPRRRTAQRSVFGRTRAPARPSIGGTRIGPTAIDE